MLALEPLAAATLVVGLLVWAWLKNPHPDEET